MSETDIPTTLEDLEALDKKFEAALQAGRRNQLNLPDIPQLNRTPEQKLRRVRHAFDRDIGTVLTSLENIREALREAGKELALAHKAKEDEKKDHFLEVDLQLGVALDHARCSQKYIESLKNFEVVSMEHGSPNGYRTKAAIREEEQKRKQQR